jgi:hypothetical protein
MTEFYLLNNKNGQKCEGTTVDSENNLSSHLLSFNPVTMAVIS